MVNFFNFRVDFLIFYFMVPIDRVRTTDDILLAQSLEISLSLRNFDSFVGLKFWS